MVVQRIQVLAQAGQVELLARFLNGLGHRSTDAAAFGAEQAEQSDRRPTQMWRDVLVGGDAGRGEHKTQAPASAPSAAKLHARS